jgi:hypothetical protein
MVRDISSSEVTSSIGESNVPYSAEFQSRIMRNIKQKYNLSENEARKFIARARSSGAYNEGDYYNLIRRQKQR